MLNIINKMKNIKEGIIALKNNIPVFVYDENVVINFTDESRQEALFSHGKKIKADVASYFPDGESLAKIIEIDEKSLASFTIDKKLAWLIYKEIRKNPGIHFLEIW